MQKTGFEKTLEELYQERADVLYRTSKAVSDALQKLDSIAKIIDDNIKKS